jgi:trehalose synthase
MIHFMKVASLRVCATRLGIKSESRMGPGTIGAIPGHMSHDGEIALLPARLDRFVPVVGDEAVNEVRGIAARFVERTRDRVFWCVSSTAVGGGVAEMLHTFLSYARGVGIDVRWVVIEGSPEFFRVTKRLHNALHGRPGAPVTDEERALYEAVQRQNCVDFLPRVRPNDVVLLHDPQTAGLAPHLRGIGAKVIWRCHVGSDVQDDVTDAAWRFLEPYLRHVDASIFSRRAYIPRILDPSRAAIIVPTIDPLGPKNQELDEEVVRGIVAHVGLVAGDPNGPTSFTRFDGTPSRVDRVAEIVRFGPPPNAQTPLVVQVSRWDDLKDPLGVMNGFARMKADERGGAELVLVGPNVNAVADDPDGARVFAEVSAAFRALPADVRRLVHLAMLPTDDRDENAAIVNALQRHATIVVQKSLAEGFGLTVTEAMWKSRAVVASAVGGIVDQIEDDKSGLLVKDPRDLDAFAAALARLLGDESLRRSLGDAARLRVRDHFLSTRSLAQYGRLIERLDLEADKERAA